MRPSICRRFTSMLTLISLLSSVPALAAERSFAPSLPVVSAAVGTTTGWAYQVKDITSGAACSHFNGAAVVNDALFFASGPADRSPSQLWRSDGMPEGTVMVKSGLEGISSLSAMHGVVYFVA